jgi:DNA (cytosine-5)-methyltransferase 1
MNVLDLFSGIGGFSLGLERAGHRTVAFCEIDPYCRRVLAKHWPGIPIYEDVTTLTAARLAADGIHETVGDTTGAGLHAGAQAGIYSGEEGAGPRNAQSERRGIDVICGGFPCQDISVAGKGAGIEGERSGLWKEFGRIIGEIRPRYVIVENVAALLGRGLSVVLGDMAALGYDAEWHCIPASAVGAPHRRDRLWIVGYPAQQCFNGSGDAEPTRRNEYSNGGSDVADADTRRELQSQVRFSEIGRWIGDCGWWLVEPDVGGGLDGFPSWLERCVGRGLSHEDSRRRVQVLRGMWSDHVSQALRRAAGGLDRISQAEILFAFVLEYEKGTDEARLLVAGEEASESFLRSLRDRGQARSAPHRPRPKKQRPNEHSDIMQPLPRLLAHDGEAYWAGSGWEDAVPRVATGIPARVDRLRALGNAIVPQIVEVIGRAINELPNDRQT